MRLSFLLTLPAAVLAVCFAISNTAAVSIGLWPITDRLMLPLYAPILLALAVGLIVGGLLFWVRGFKRAIEVRRLRHQIEAYEKARDAETTTSTAAIASDVTPTGLP